MCDCHQPFPTTAGSGEPASGGTRAVGGGVPPVVSPGVPLAGSITFESSGESQPGGDAPPVLQPQLPIPFPPFKFCGQTLPEGCYALSFAPTNSLTTFQGTLRVDRSAPDGGADSIIVSGDLYRKPFFLPPIPIPQLPFPQIPIPDPPLPFPPGPFPPGPVPPVPFPPGPVPPGPIPPGPLDTPSAAAAASAPDAPGPVLVPLPFRPVIPIFPRNLYHSYLKATSISAPALVPRGAACTVTLVVEQYDYTQPPAGSFTGSFPAAPSRTATITLSPAPATFPFTGPNLQGRWVEGGIDKGSVTLSKVSNFFRRATVEIDSLLGAAVAQPVPDGAGGMEYFDTIYAKHGWQLSVITDNTNVPVPAGVTPTNCWSSGDLHNLMSANRNPATNLDKEWRIHLMFVPARLGCGRGVMFDTIDVPREGCASFSDDGYPTTDSANFGVAANQLQRNIARAFLRSATHEITHTFNQIHQEQETAADNSIMTTTPSVADVLGGPATGAPGVFPDQINLAVNTNVRHHLVHMPDPVIRPGGWPFGAWFGGTVPQATDRLRFADSELELTVAAPDTSVVLGEPFELSWTLTNRTGGALVVPNDVSMEGLFASMTITDPDGTARPFRPYVISCDTVRLAALAPGGSVSGSHRVFWSSEGFAFPRPGQYRVAVAVTWSAQGVPVGVESEVEVFVGFPTSGADNDAAGLVLSPEVGKWVALGGNAYHLTEATRRLSAIAPTAAAAEADVQEEAPRLLAGFADLLPDPDRLDG